MSGWVLARVMGWVWALALVWVWVWALGWVLVLVRVRALVRAVPMARPVLHLAVALS